MRKLLICTPLGTFLSGYIRTIQDTKFKFSAFLSFMEATKCVKFKSGRYTGFKVGIFWISLIVSYTHFKVEYLFSAWVGGVAPLYVLWFASAELQFQCEKCWHHEGKQTHNSKFYVNTVEQILSGYFMTMKDFCQFSIKTYVVYIIRI